MDNTVESFMQRLHYYRGLQEKLVLHRGWHRLEHGDESRPVENTKDAYLNASSIGVKFAECDIHATLDDELVLLHNPTAKAHIREDERSELDDVPVSELTYAQIQKIRLEDGSSIPLVQDVLEVLLASKQTKLVVELKCNRSGPLFAKLLHNCRHLIPAVGLVFSFMPQAIVSFAHEYESTKELPRLPLAWLTEASYYNCATMRLPRLFQDENNYPLKYCENMALSEFLEKMKVHEIGMYIEYHKLLTPQNLKDLREDYKAVTMNSSMVLGIWSSRKTDADFDTVHKLSNLAPYVDMINTDFPTNFFELPGPIDSEPYNITVN